ncbi:MAG: chalcone isomerase family protein [Terrimicrobiaceae bacterium]
MKFRLFSFAILALLQGSFAQALTIEGVTVPPQVNVSGKALPLNGAGLRTVVLLVVPIKAYVAAFYAPAPLRSGQAVLSSPGPLKFTFTFLQGVGQGQVTQAWTTQFQQSVSYSYPGLASDQSAFIAMFGPLKKGGIESVEIEGNITRVYDDGALKGVINGRDFQKAFLSLWFGTNPVMPELKAALLGN